MDSRSPRSAQDSDQCVVGRECVFKSSCKADSNILTPGYMILGVDIGCLAGCLTGLIEVDDAKAQK